MFDRKQGYAKADAVDELIQDVVAEYPITEDTHMGWLTYLRTIRTSVDLLEAAILKSMRLHERKAERPG